MTVAANGAPTASALRRSLVHLRLAFSLVLTPLFLWGAWLAGAPPAALGRLVFAYVVVHVLLYGGMNAYNSYWDQDDGPIGALLEPPPADRAVWRTAVVAKTVALVASLALGPRFAGLTLLAIGLSVLYSHPRSRWKERPALAALTIFVGQGVLGVLWGWLTAVGPDGPWPIGWLAWLGITGAALWTLGFYPLTGVYQIPGDAARGVRTLAVALGVAGCFRWAAVVGTSGGALVGLVLILSGAFFAALAAAAYLVLVARAAVHWRARFASGDARDNQRYLMRLAYANGLFFSLLFGALILASWWPAGGP